MSFAARILCVGAVVVLAGCVRDAAPFPGRARRAADIWCPVEQDDWDPVLRRISTEGRRTYGDSGVPENTPPPWLDRKRFAAGKEFANKYPLGIAFAHVHALYLLFAVPSVLDVLVFTGNSDTPDEAFARYVDTVNGVGAWYTSDFFKRGTVGYEQMKRVRGLHALVRDYMNEEKDQDAIRNKTRVPGDFSDCKVSAAMRRDLDAAVRGACPFAGRKNNAAKRDAEDNTLGEGGAADGSLWMSQYDMSMTQWAFVGPVILFPEAYGIANATDEGLDGFVHLWEVIGYSLGIDDRHNFCQGGLRATLRRSEQALSSVVLPSMREARPPWEYMSRCMADGLGYVLPGVGFKMQLVNMLRFTLNTPSPSVEAMLSPAQRQSVRGYRGIMSTLRSDRRHLYWTPIGEAFKQVYSYLRVMPKENVLRLRRRSPHRVQGCSPSF